MKKTGNNLATMYFFRLKDLEKKLGKSERKRKKTETELEKIRRENEELKRKLDELEEENENLKGSKKTYAKMLFRGKRQKTSSPQRGCKKGHKPAFRQQPAEEDIRQEIDVTVACCPDCGGQFNGCKRRYERIIEDIVVRPQTEISRYIIHQYECQNCGKRTSAKSANIIAGSPFGRKTFATVLFYRFRLNTPLNKIREALKELHGLEISIGGIQGLLYQASVQFGEKYEELKQLLRNGQMMFNCRVPITFLR